MAPQAWIRKRFRKKNEIRKRPEFIPADGNNSRQKKEGKEINLRTIG